MSSSERSMAEPYVTAKPKRIVKHVIRLFYLHVTTEVTRIRRMECTHAESNFSHQSAAKKVLKCDTQLSTVKLMDEVFYFGRWRMER